MYIGKKGDLQIFEYKQKCYGCKKKDVCAGIGVPDILTYIGTDDYAFCIDCLNLMMKELKKYKRRNNVLD